MGREADTAGSVAEALELLGGGARYDVVLLDLAMPEQDGLDLARRVRADATLAGVRLLMLTSVTSLDPDEVRAAGVDELLTKPVLSSLLRTALLPAAGEPADEPAPQAERRPWRARAGSSSWRTTRSTRWSRPACSPPSATPPTPPSTGSPPSRPRAPVPSTRS